MQGDKGTGQRWIGVSTGHMGISILQTVKQKGETKVFLVSMS